MPVLTLLSLNPPLYASSPCPPILSLQRFTYTLLAEWCLPHSCKTLLQLGSTAIGIQTKFGVVLAVEKRITSPLLARPPQPLPTKHINPSQLSMCRMLTGRMQACKAIRPGWRSRYEPEQPSGVRADCGLNPVPTRKDPLESERGSAAYWRKRLCIGSDAGWSRHSPIAARYFPVRAVHRSMRC